MCDLTDARSPAALLLAKMETVRLRLEGKARRQQDRTREGTTDRSLIGAKQSSPRPREEKFRITRKSWRRAIVLATIHVH